MAKDLARGQRKKFGPAARPGSLYTLSTFCLCLHRYHPHCHVFVAVFVIVLVTVSDFISVTVCDSVQISLLCVTGAAASTNNSLETIFILAVECSPTPKQQFGNTLRRYGNLFVTFFIYFAKVLLCGSSAS